jgi:hypothetical protein
MPDSLCSRWCFLCWARRVPIDTSTLRICANEHCCGVVQVACRREYSIDNLFVELGKNETRPHNACLPFSSSETKQISGYSFLCMLSKKEMCIPEIRDTRLLGTSPFSLDRRRAFSGRISFYLHPKLNYCQIQYSVHQKLNTRLQKLHTLQKQNQDIKWPYCHTLSIFHTNIK